MMACDSLATTIIIPCYNEEKRLPRERLFYFLDQAKDIRFLLINDGSTDNTASIIEDFARQRSDKIKTLHLSINQGKGEAVRLGLLNAMADESKIVGYWDADLSTPLTEILRLRRILLDHESLDAVIGARVKLIGRTINRTILRHYIGRIIGTIISLSLQFAVYDTQCGAKLFKASPMLKELLKEPFLTRWLFDVEIIARSLLSIETQGKMSINFYEEPLEVWQHVGGSKIGLGDFPGILIELWRIRCTYTKKLRKLKKCSFSNV